MRAAAAPSWVKPLALPTPLKVPPDAGGSYLVAHDRQLRAFGNTVHSFTRIVEHVVTTAGVDSPANIKIHFDPSYERVELHEIVVRRGSRRINALDLDKLRIVQREQDLDRKIFSGIKTVVYFIPDVRAGDTVDYSYSLVGANPVFEGRIAGSTRIEGPYPIGFMRRRIVMPRGRALQVKFVSRAPHASAGGKGHRTVQVRRMVPTVEYSWEQRDIAARPAARRSRDDDPFVRMVYTEARSWREVAAWASRQFTSPEAASRSVGRQIERIRARPKDPVVQLGAATRFVQDEILSRSTECLSDLGVKDGVAKCQQEFERVLRASGEL